MDLNLQKQTVCTSEVIYDGVTEQPLECDVLLPDYCPDISKILRCEVVPSLLSHVVSGDKLSIDGMAVAHLYYLSEDGCIRHAEYKIPYTKVIELRTAPQNPTATISQTVDYFNCRAVSPRRLDMRGAVSMNVRVSSQVEEQVVCGGNEAGLQLCREAVENTRVLPQSVRQTTIREEMELGNGKPAVGNVIRYSASADVADFKVISGKLVTKGEANVKIIYQSEEDAKKLEVMEYALPVSQIVDMEGVDEDCNCSVWYDVCGVDITPKQNSDGENRAFSVELVLNACATANRRINVEAVTDCYSTQYECKQSQKQIPFLKLLNTVDENHMYKETLDLPPNVKSIIDLWCIPGAVNTRVEPDGVVVTGKLNVCMFVYEDDDNIAYFEQMREYNQRIPNNDMSGTIQFAPVVRVGTATFTLSGHDKLEVRCAARIRGGIYSLNRKKVISDIAVDESRPKTRQENVLYLYYASEQEPVWEIAKRYNTSVNAIQAENQLEGSVLSGKAMLLIPMK